MTFVLKAQTEYPDGSQQTQEFAESTISIGRVEENALCLAHPSISRQHASIVLNDKVLELQDLGSSNGTRVNNQLIQETTQVQPNQTIMFGDVKVTFSLPEEFIKTQMMQAIDEPLPEQKTQVMSGITHLTELEIAEPGKEPHIMVIAKEVTSVGRADNSDIWLSDPTASREHLHIVREGNNFSFCKQPNCSGIVTLNNRVTDQGNLKPGDQLVVGQTKITFQPNAKDQFEQQQAEKRKKISYVIASILSVVILGMVYQQFYSAEKMAERGIAQAETLFRQNQYFAVLEQTNKAEQYQDVWTDTQKKRFYSIRSLANLEQGLKLLQANRWQESLLYFEQAINSSNQVISLEDIRIRINLSVFSALSQYLDSQLNQNTVQTSQSIYNWLNPLYSNTNQEELSVFQRRLAAKVAVADYEKQIQKQFISEQPEHSVTWLMQCFEDPASTQEECNRFADMHHVKVYGILNQKAVASRLDKQVTAKSLEKLLHYVNMLTSVKPNIAKYQELARELEVFHQNVLAKEKLKQDLLGDELDLDDFSD